MIYAAISRGNVWSQAFLFGSQTSWDATAASKCVPWTNERNFRRSLLGCWGRRLKSCIKLLLSKYQQNFETHGRRLLQVVAMEDACGFLRRGRRGDYGGNWGKGYGRGNFELRMKDISSTQIQRFPKFRCTHPTCRYNMVDGHLKCPQCGRQMEAVTDANIATEIVRREAMARARGVPFSLDKVVFHHPRRITTHFNAFTICLQI